MPYTKEIIFHSREEAHAYYKALGFILTDDKRLILDKKVSIEIVLHKLGPELLRSSVSITET